MNCIKKQEKLAIWVQAEKTASAREKARTWKWLDTRQTTVGWVRGLLPASVGAEADMTSWTLHLWAQAALVLAAEDTL